MPATREASRSRASAAGAVRVLGEPPVDEQGGEPVHRRPRGDRQFHGIAALHVAGRLALDDRLDQEVEGACAGLGGTGCAALSGTSAPNITRRYEGWSSANRT